MRSHSPFLADDLAEFDDRLLARADRVVSMQQIFDGDRGTAVVGLRHDVDNVFTPALELARWEADRGYQSTFFIRHTAPYWFRPGLRDGLEEIAELGHEVGIHADALTEALQTGGDPHEILMAAIERLRGWGHTIRGVVGHGHSLCYVAGYINDEQFTECGRPEMGDPDRRLQHNGVTVDLDPRPLSFFGLDYESLRCAPRSLYLSDSGGQWNVPFDDLCVQFPPATAQLHVLQHPDWWSQAFVAEKVAA